MSGRGRTVSECSIPEPALGGAGRGAGAGTGCRGRPGFLSRPPYGSPRIWAGGQFPGTPADGFSPRHTAGAAPGRSKHRYHIPIEATLTALYQRKSSSGPAKAAEQWCREKCSLSPCPPLGRGGADGGFAWVWSHISRAWPWNTKKINNGRRNSIKMPVHKFFCRLRSIRRPSFSAW